MFKSESIGGEPIAIEQVQIRTPRLILKDSCCLNPTTLVNLEIKPQTSCAAVALATLTNEAVKSQIDTSILVEWEVDLSKIRT